MDLRRDVVIRSFFVVTLLVAAVGVAAAGPTGESPSWCAYMGVDSTSRSASEGAPKVLLPRQARYDVDLLGNLAHGSLALEFANLGETELLLKFFARSTPGLQLTELSVVADESAQPRPLTYEFARAAQAGKSARRSKVSSSAQQQGFGTDEVSLGAEESTWIRVGFTQSLDFGEGSFRLRLPSIGGSCSTGSPAADSIVPLSVTLQVHHDQPLMHAESPSHALLVEFEGDYTVVETVTPDRQGQVAFEFEYALGSVDEPALSSYVSPANDNGERDVLVVFAPSIDPAEESVRLKEVLFVLDTSGSMKAQAGLGPGCPGGLPGSAERVGSLQSRGIRRVVHDGVRGAAGVHRGRIE